MDGAEAINVRNTVITADKVMTKFKRKARRYIPGAMTQDILHNTIAADHTNRNPIFPYLWLLHQHAIFCGYCIGLKMAFRS